MGKHNFQIASTGRGYEISIPTDPSWEVEVGTREYADALTRYYDNEISDDEFWAAYRKGGQWVNTSLSSKAPA